ncbi:RNA helicase [Komagataella phaffii CBS 7435]|uniref:RNA helicase n=2 Tax=Komagataella phaffii TaxID=460519 RepID=C4R557_KOMPG|nr:RNA helicase in the DEAD-box family, necessary for prespliceosome formation [Komagataella phaffii GS115]AOA63953.1 GQ67_03729T0 [Komagataella phaffii]CAH2449533.1 RNA helicase [Komagataella phaffii CBS 7435]AOA69370.1 GQ68_03701T0 [Komagataella phaffii GS115]CAY70693.1 RNA helicase in the DEAD-box family, necessary for prespliceosome formation [Komagataella phaffii GS115]CCA39515.1 RNA helicase [Komagataella phaffii CBS 7435]
MELSLEEKKRKRLEKLALWKKKKEKEEQEKNVKNSQIEEPPIKKVKGFAIKKHNQPARQIKRNAKGLRLFTDQGEESELKKKTPLLVNGIQNSKKGSNHDKEPETDLDSLLDELKSNPHKLVTKNQKTQNVIIEETQEDDASFYDSQDDAQALLETLKNKNKKVIKFIEPSTEPFEKQFYTEPESISSLPETDVQAIRAIHNIKIRGKHIQRPITEWCQLALPQQFMSVIEDLKYEAPTPIQSEALPNLMSGKDLIGIAKTGSGKTLAFLLPMFRQIISQPDPESGEGPIGVILTPTRELALQIFKECKPFMKSLNLKGICVYGGASISQQISDIKKRVHFAVCTPGRLIDLLTANSGRVTNLSRTSYLVLDEADRMFDMGFEPQVMKIIPNTRPDRQTLVFSATFPPKMEALAKKVLNNPLEVIVGEKSVVADTITQKVFVIDPQERFSKLLELLGTFKSKDPTGKVLVFVERQDSADVLLTNLLKRGYNAQSLHGGKEQMDRDFIIQDFKTGNSDILVATSVAARGLDVKRLNLVINYDSPNHMEDYVHRVGRTGRAGSTGEAVTFLTAKDYRAAYDVSRALKVSKQLVPDNVQAVANVFIEQLKTGSAKRGSGYGGKGLEKLQEERELKRQLEKTTYGDEVATADPKKENTHGATATPPPLDQPVEEFKVVFGSEPSGNGTTQFHATIEINDLPQQVRWTMTNRVNISDIIEASNASITSKGRFYPTGKAPSEGEDPKLYLLIEADSEASVNKAVSLFKGKMIEALLQETKDKSKGRYTIT